MSDVTAVLQREKLPGEIPDALSAGFQDWRHFKCRAAATVVITDLLMA
jgi:hypothetical protein